MPDDPTVTNARSAPRRAGGAATGAGMSFQAFVSAWAASNILAESMAVQRWGLPLTVSLQSLRCETEQPVDDLMLATSDNGFIFIQVKRSLALSSQENSPLASAMDQFCRQFIACRNDGSQPWERPLDRNLDRLVLAVGVTTPQSVQRDLRLALNKHRYAVPNVEHQEEGSRYNYNESHALEVAQAHLRRSWLKHMSSELDSDTLRELQQLIWVDVLDVDDNGTAEREAKQLLRSDVVRIQARTDDAWRCLVTTCHGFISTRSGGDRTSLLRVLQDSGIPVSSAPSYREDIQRLNAYSQTVVRDLERFSKLEVGPKKVQIERPAVQAIQEAAESGHLVVLGDPGAGKSGALHALAKRFEHGGRDVIFLAVDHIASESESELAQELRLQHDFVETLAAWVGEQPGFLIVDALDAARSEVAAGMLRRLLEATIKQCQRWHVVASIRRFDLKYSNELQQLFRGAPPENTAFLDAEFSRVRHVRIPLLSPEELNQIASQSPDLANLIQHGHNAFTTLLANPFNLRLAAELLGDGVLANELTSIQNQIELLDHYWQRRVLETPRQSDAREAVLRLVVDEMLKRRSLRADRVVVQQNSVLSEALNELLGVGVLAEWQPSSARPSDRNTLIFGHHVIFDYAVARLRFYGDDALKNALVEDEELILVVRPSVVYRLQIAWREDSRREAFWNLVLGITGTEQIREIAKLIGPMIAAESATTITDFEQLITALDGDATSSARAGERALMYLIGAIHALAPVRKVVGREAGPWCALLERLSRQGVLRSSVIHSLVSLAFLLKEQIELLSQDDSKLLGQAVRRFLEFLWSENGRQRLSIRRSLELVCQTFSTDPVSSRVLLNRVLEPARLDQFGAEEIGILGRNIKALSAVDVELTHHIYRVAFERTDTSDDQVPLSAGGLINLTSTRKQDWSLLRYSLASDFPAFLTAEPVVATQTIIQVMKEHYRERHLPYRNHETLETHAFDFRGRQAHVSTDYSSIWDQAVNQHDEAIKMLDAFSEHVTTLAREPSGATIRRSVLDVIATDNVLAVFWKRLLAIGATFPRTLGSELRDLLCAQPILMGIDTRYPAGELLRTVFQELDEQDRLKIERAILALPGRAEQTRDVLLRCLPEDAVRSAEATNVLQRLRANHETPQNTPPQTMQFTGRTWTEEDELADRGVPIHDQANSHIRKVGGVAKAFAAAHLNSVPTMEAVQAVLPHLQDLRALTATAKDDNVHPNQLEYAWGHLAEACERITRIEGDWDAIREPMGFALSTLIDASHQPSPNPNDEIDAQFDTTPSWGSPSARIEAAIGLIQLCRFSPLLDTSLRAAIVRLSQDSVPAVRFQIAERLVNLYHSDQEMMWELANHFSSQESSRGVLRGLMANSLVRLAGHHPDRVAEITKHVVDRDFEGGGAKDLREVCVHIFTSLYLWQDQPLSREAALRIANEPLAHIEDTRRLIIDAGDLIPLRDDGQASTPTRDVARPRALDLLQRVLAKLQEAHEALEAEHGDWAATAWSEAAVNQLQSLLELAGLFASRLYFGSGAYGSRGVARDATTSTPELVDIKQLYRDLAPFIDGLSRFPVLMVTHHLLEILEFVIPADPIRVFTQIGQVVRAGQRAEYQFDSMAADLVVKLVERYLADYRDAIRQDASARKMLLEVLDIFVRVGWPKASLLTYRLEEFYR